MLSVVNVEGFVDFWMKLILDVYGFEDVDCLFDVVGILVSEGFG